MIPNLGRKPSHRRLPPFRRSLLAGVILAASLGQAQATTITLNGESHTVNAGDAINSWNVINGSYLEFTPGSEGSFIKATNSEVVLDGATLQDTSDTKGGVEVKGDSRLTVTHSTISGSGNGAVVSVGGANAVATLTDSSLTGSIGLITNQGSHVTLANTQVHGTAEFGGFGSGVNVNGGNLDAIEGTSILGDSNGVRMSFTSSDPLFDTLRLDASHVESVADSAIRVGDPLQGDNPDVLPAGEANILIANGSTVVGGNGVLLEVLFDNVTNLVVDNSQLTGDILGSDSAVGATNVVLQNGASLDGQLSHVDSFAVFGSQFTGSVHVTEGETLMQIADGSTATAENGPLLDVLGGSAALLVDASTVNSDLQVIDGTRVDVQLQNGAQLNGEMTVTGGEASLAIVNGSSVNSDSGTLIDVQGGSAQVVIDSSSVNGNILAGGESTDVFVQNGAQLNGQMTVIGGDASLKILDGSTVTSDTGTLLDVQSGTVQMIVDNSSASGNILAESGSTDVFVQNGAQLNGQMTVSSGDASLAIIDGSTVTSDTGTLLDVQNGTVQMIVDNSSASGDVLVAGGSTDVYVQNDAQFDGHLTVTGGDASLIVSNGANANAGSPLLDVQGGSGELIVDNATATGDVIASGGTASVTLENFGVFTGQLENVSQLNVNNGGTWNMVGDARVENVAMQGGTINFGDGSAYRTLTLGSLSGNGSFAMNTDIAGKTGDLLNVEGQATGDYQLRFKNTGAEVEEGSLQVVHTGGGDANFSVLGGGVDVGTYQFQLAQHGDDWFLEATREITPSTASVLGLFSAAPSVWYGELSSLRSRMGEVRNGQGSGVWARTYNNRFKLSAASNLNYDQDQSGLSIGADGQLPSASGQWLLGVMAGTSKSDLNLKRGTSGDVDSYYVGLYSTWLAEDGYYVDAVLKTNRFDNSSDVRMSDGTKAKGSYDNNGLGVSVEAGKHIKLKDDWFVEPYAQIASLWVDGDKYHLDNGMQAQSNHANSLLGKVGTSFGKRIALANGGFAEPYAKLGVAHEFVDNNQVKVNDDKFTNDLSGTRGEIGGGVAVQVSEKLQLHFDVDYSKGSNVEQPYGVNLGLRYNF